MSGAELCRVAVTGRDANLTACLLARILSGTGRTGLVASDPHTDAAAAVQRQCLALEKAGCRTLVAALPDLPVWEDWLETMTLDACVITSWDTGEVPESVMARSRRAVLNCDDPGCREAALRHPGEVYTCSERRRNVTVTAGNLTALPFATRFEVCTGEQISRVLLPIPQGMGLYPGLLAVTAALCLGRDLEESTAALSRVTAIPGFSKPITSAGGIVAAGYFQTETERIHKI